MVEIVLGALVVIGVFVFWCDVTDSWNNVFLWNKTAKNTNPPHFLCDRNASSERRVRPISALLQDALL
jgi:hypothetical protein